MKKIIYITLLVAFTFSVNKVKAQKGFVSFGWQFGQATENTKDFIDERSYEGANFRVEWYVVNNLAFGLEVNYSHFYDDLGIQSFESGNTTYTGASFKYFDALPVLFTGRFYFGGHNPRSIFIPYFGFGAGGYYVTERIEVGSVAFQKDNWTYGYVPQVGLMIKLDKQLWFFGEVGYNKLYNRKEINEHTYYSGTAGLKFAF